MKAATDTKRFTTEILNDRLPQNDRKTQPLETETTPDHRPDAALISSW